MEKFIEELKVATISEIIEGKELKFEPHPKFKGVSMMNLVKGNLTNNKISCHLVKVDSKCALENHVHENNLEIHEVIFGDGTCFIGENKVNYIAGTVGVIPENTLHKVIAGENGIYILAKFVPALL